MRRYGHIILTVIILLLGGVAGYAQKQNNLIVAQDELVLLIDLRSSKTSVDSILKRAGITGINVDAVLDGNYTGIVKQGWALKEKQKYVVQFNKAVTINTDVKFSKPYLLTTTIIKTEGRPGYPGEVPYGVNKFAKITVRELPSGVTRFFVPGNLKAKKVLLSGSFNLWSTSKGIMLKTDSGWIRDVKLNPGIYAYKYIINGNWTHDIYNRLSEDDSFHSVNSIYFRYNYTFKLNGYASARKVLVTGSFNKWNANEILMRKKGNTWIAGLYLHDGLFQYRFLVDGKWITDPANTEKVKDDQGITNSVVNLGESVNFKLKGYDKATKVCVAGTFNNWKPDNLYLKRVNNEWLLPLKLKPGNYKYKFIIDGNWITDPANTCYAVDGSENNSFVAVKPTHVFRLQGYGNAHSVHLAGSFNDWNPDEYTMCRSGNEWVMSMNLPPGKHRYKFIVDGNWILDPGNKLWEDNEHNTGNSVLWLE